MGRNNTCGASLVVPGLRFRLFSEIEFEVSFPVALIECYCFQSDFYANYDLPQPRRLELVSKIGARIEGRLLQECHRIIKDAGKKVRILKGIDLDGLLALDGEDIGDQVEELGHVIKELMAVKGIGLSRATKILHTLYPSVIPIIDTMLQETYKTTKSGTGWTEDNCNQILLDYYRNLQEETNKRNLTWVFNVVSANGLQLTKVRVFDIIWWSYLKAKRLGDRSRVKWCTIK